MLAHFKPRSLGREDQPEAKPADHAAAPATIGVACGKCGDRHTCDKEPGYGPTVPYSGVCACCGQINRYSRTDSGLVSARFGL